jgi:hypothetical protein
LDACRAIRNGPKVRRRSAHPTWETRDLFPGCTLHGCRARLPLEWVEPTGLGWMGPPGGDAPAQLRVPRVLCGTVPPRAELRTNLAKRECGEYYW